MIVYSDYTVVANIVFFSGKSVVAVEGVTRLTPGLAWMTRADVAEYMLHCVTDRLHVKQMVAIGLSRHD